MDKRYNLSAKRIVSRLFLTGVLGILFGVAMFPFMRVADGLLYAQRASIGSQNIYRMIALWGLFTVLVSMYTLIKKHLRMVSVFLFVCWILSVIVGVIVYNNDLSSKICRRSYPYNTPKEISRALDLISQRWGIDSKVATGTLIQHAFNYLNCTDIQYSESNSSDSEAYFLYNQDADLQHLKIFLNPLYKNLDDLTLATLLNHELIHVGQNIDEITNSRKIDCYSKEAQAFVSQAMFVSWLNDEERRSIYTRLNDDVNKNPGLAMLILTLQRQDESYMYCKKQVNMNKSSQDEFNSCVWGQLETRIESDIKNDPGYKKECE